MAIKQLGALYLTAASAYTVAIVLSHHPALADHAGQASELVRSSGAAATSAFDAYVLQPGWKFVRSETAALDRRIVAAWETRTTPAAPRQFAELTVHTHRLSANPAHSSHLRITPKVQAVPPPPDAQFAAPPPPNTPPPSEDDNGMRMSESDQYSSSRNPAVSSAPPAPPPASSNETTSSSIDATRRSQTAQPPAPRSQFQIAPETRTASLPPSVNAADTSSLMPNLPPPTTTEIAQVEQRLKDNLTSEMLQNFELFLYVSKSANGPVSQRMFVFEKQPTGDLALAYNWPVSTGREKVEISPAGQSLPTNTPAGYYELDPHRFFTHYTSGQWGEAMPYAMFFNWKKDGEQTGLAIHSASGDDVAQLGSRASAGCVRLPPEAARTLFSLIKAKYRGLAPKFAIDRHTGTMSNDGILVHDGSGHVQLADGYKVLVFIEDYGGENVVAAMY